jgi:type VI secretion system protein ImpM
MAADDAPVGFYGKLPCRGDFLQRRVSQRFVEVWDAWLQQCLAESRSHMQERWLEAYLTSPAWRFVVSPGICGDGAYGGVMVPSVDRVGRYFPLTIVASWEPENSALAVACGAQAWFDRVEELALDAPEASDFDLFDTSIAELPALANAQDAAEVATLRGHMNRVELSSEAQGIRVPLRSVNALQRAVNLLAARELERSLQPISLWWSDGSKDTEPTWVCQRGLPPAQGFARMLSEQLSEGVPCCSR